MQCKEKLFFYLFCFINILFFYYYLFYFIIEQLSSGSVFISYLGYLSWTVILFI